MSAAARQITKIDANQEKGGISVVWTQFDGDGEIPGWKRPGRLGFVKPAFADSLDDLYSAALDRLFVSGIWDEQWRKLTIDFYWNAEDGADISISIQAYPEPGNSARIATVKLSTFIYYPSGHASRDDTISSVSGRYATEAEAKVIESVLSLAGRWVDGESAQGNLLSMPEKG